MMNAFSLQPIGVIHSPYKEKFGTPRQSGLIPAKAAIEMYPPYDRIEAFKGLDGFSHIWITFIFHQAMGHHWKEQVRPPRLGGNQKVGVFASRSPFRPNPLGQSVVPLINIESKQGALSLNIEGIDLIEGTPVIDIKPYVPYVDSIPSAAQGFAREKPQPCLNVEFSENVDRQIASLPEALHLKQLITQVLAMDPRPAYKKGEQNAKYALNLEGFNVHWQVSAQQVRVLSIEAIDL